MKCLSTTYFCIGFLCVLYQPNSAAGQTQSATDFYSECGHSSFWPTVWRGQVIPQHKALKNLPWLVNIRRENTSVLCGGTVIGPNLVMTAAHCLLYRQSVLEPSNLWIYVNSHNISDHKNTHEKPFAVKRFHIHDGYTFIRGEHSFDLAILETYANIDVRAPLCLPCAADSGVLPELVNFNPGQPNIDETCLIVGWGWTDRYSGSPSKVPMGAQVKIMPNRKCGEYWPDLDETMLCTFQSAGDAAACMGDSGGPLYCLDRTSDRYVLQGVVSWGKVNCAKKPSVYTNVAFLRPWIAKILKKLGLSEICVDSNYSPNLVPTTTTTLPNPIKSNVKLLPSSAFYSQCGNSNMATATVIGGQAIPQHKMRSDLPWLVNLRTRSEPFDVICGGTVIGPNLILTTAHCLFNGKILRKASDLWVYVNSYNVSHKNDEEFRIAIKSLNIHNRYDRMQYSFDIAILETFTNMGVDFPLCIPCLAELQTEPSPSLITPRQPSVDETCLIVGWGATEERSRSSLPMGAEVRIMSNKECKKHWPKVNRSHLCTSPGTSAACNGDSGGPLYCYDRSSARYVLHGVISWGAVGCTSKPSVYTNVAVLRRWIASKLKELGMPEICSETDSYAPKPCSLSLYESCRDEPLVPDFSNEPIENSSTSRPVALVLRVRHYCDRDTSEFKIVGKQFVLGTLIRRTHMHKTETMAQCMDKCCQYWECESGLFYEEIQECYLYSDHNCNPTSSVAEDEQGITYFAKGCD